MRTSVEAGKVKWWHVVLYPVTVTLYYLLYFGTMPVWLPLYLWRKRGHRKTLARERELFRITWD